MAWHRPYAKPLSEPMIASLLMYIYVTRPQWVKCSTFNWWYECFAFCCVSLWHATGYYPHVRGGYFQPPPPPHPHPPHPTPTPTLTHTPSPLPPPTPTPPPGSATMDNWLPSSQLPTTNMMEAPSGKEKQSTKSVCLGHPDWWIWCKL